MIVLITFSDQNHKICMYVYIHFEVNYTCTQTKNKKIYTLFDDVKWRHIGGLKVK